MLLQAKTGRTLRARRPPHPRHAAAVHARRAAGALGWRQRRRPRGGPVASAWASCPRGAAPNLQTEYEDAARAAGHEPGMCLVPPVDQPTVVFVADDVDRAWDELGPYLMNDVRGYAEWNEGDTTTANISFVKTAEELRGREPEPPHLHRRRSGRPRPRRNAPRPASPRRRASARGRLALPAHGGRRGHAGVVVTGRRAPAPRSGREQHALDDALVARAAADVAREDLADLGLVG